ncbi:MAG: 4-hydroxybenzoyl-CoA thioesterase, partial [bacterium]
MSRVAAHAHSAPARVEYSVALADWHSRSREILAVRRAVFIDEQGVSEALEIDPRDHRHIHALAYDTHGGAIATGRLLADGQV